MNHSRPADKLDLLRWKVEQMESGTWMLRLNHRDFTQREIGIFKLEIAFLEKVSARALAFRQG
jgi:hypothetical protein